MKSSGHDGRTLEKFAPKVAPPLRASATSRFCGDKFFIACPPPPFCLKKILSASQSSCQFLISYNSLTATFFTGRNNSLSRIIKPVIFEICGIQGQIKLWIAVQFILGTT
jgi:hypothetical protein